ncbi:hypothetical protein AVEN_37738-1 [Araneus ventricosus]|uniref:Uncharacterized protein n=1 Tax=Araneus ventricosus TaxID=182803 RepID=A0A4Y2BUZ5_ARAVE|nr:hypothetical protein AVEN_37738-1 [Araneus ventricosus]
MIDPNLQTCNTKLPTPPQGNRLPLSPTARRNDFCPQLTTKSTSSVSNYGHQVGGRSSVVVCNFSENKESRSENKTISRRLKNKTWNRVTTQSRIKRTKEDNLMQRRSSLSAHSTTPIAPPTS